MYTGYMIDRAVRQTLGTGSPRAYAAAMAGLWIDLEFALARLDTLAADAERLLDDCDTLPALQYELHCAAELVSTLVAPEDAAVVHNELAEALAEARELTAETAEALVHGGLDAAWPLVWEWRGALFRIRFARVRLERPPAAPAAIADASTPPSARAPVLAAGAVAVGSALVLGAALLGLWLLMALTLAGTAAGSVLLRP
jgi:hypothetical protein